MPLTESEETVRGEKLAELLRLRHHTVLNVKRYQTEWGDKTALGLFRTIQRVVEKGE